tara:strand:+ start:211 stop:426 length:216 start_codon:yes stop_codon:yes gene_type:complete
MQLNSDYPLLPGSCYFAQVAGNGGIFSNESLEKFRVTMNKSKFDNATRAMDTFSNGVKQLKKNTPTKTYLR